MNDGQISAEQMGAAFGAAIAGFIGAGGKVPLAALTPEAPAAGTEPEPATLDELFVQATKTRDRLAREVGNGEGTALTLEAEAVEIVAVADPAAPEDPFWAAARQRIGIQEDHSNAMFLVATLFHVDQPNLNGDMISAAEAAAALPSLAFQPMDMAPTMDQHERERMYGMNGIRGFIYAQRMIADQAQVGVVLWARDFPDIAQKVVDFRASLGASFDLVAKSADIMNIGGDGQTQRNLKGITFLGGALLAKARAGDPNTTIGDVRYQGKPIEQLEEDQRMAQQPKETETPAAVATAPAAAVTAQTPPAAAAAPAPETNAVEQALAEAQTRIKALQTEVEQADLKTQSATAQQEAAEAALVEMTARAEKAEGELAAQAEAAAKIARVEARFAALTAMAAEVKRVLFEDDAAKETLLAEIADLADPEFETFRLRKELDLLKSGKTVTATKQTNVEAQAARQPAQPGAFSSLTGSSNTGIQPGSEDPRELGRRLVNARKGVKAE